MEVKNTLKCADHRVLKRLASASADFQRWRLIRYALVVKQKCKESRGAASEVKLCLQKAQSETSGDAADAELCEALKEGVWTRR
ncbi:hypothetical protein SRHO_G00248550 [Serrasalmus rhombeus]